MPIFHYKALTESGDVVAGSIEAKDREAALSEIRSTGHLPIDASATSSERSIPFARFGPRAKSAVSRRDVTMLTNELATLLGAGMPLDASLKMLERTRHDDALRGVVRRLGQDVQKGRSLSQAFSAQGALFGPYFVNMIRAGEASGDLAGALQRLARSLEADAALRESVVASVTYPVLLSVVAILAILFLLIVVVPEFVPLFDDVATTLPLPTRALFWLSEQLRAWWWLMLLVPLAIAGAFARWAQQPKNRRILSLWVLRLPILGELLQSYVVAQFARNLATLLASGVGLFHAMRLAIDVVANPIIKEELEACVDGIRSGTALRTLLADAPHMPRLAVELVAVGEQTGQLPAMLAKVADVCDEEVRGKLKHVLTLLEPALILGLGAVVGAIIASILTALLGLNDLVAM